MAITAVMRTIAKSVKVMSPSRLAGDGVDVALT
jgi:hypothetical protein